MSNHIYQMISDLIEIHQTRNPYEILSNLKAVVTEKNEYSALKGFCLIHNHGAHVLINGALDDVTKRIVAAHELGHLVLHKQELLANALFDAALCSTDTKQEFEANLFAADLLLDDEAVLSHCNEMSPDVFSMARILWTLPELLNLKLLSMKKRGYDVVVPLPIANPLV